MFEKQVNEHIGVKSQPARAGPLVESGSVSFPIVGIGASAGGLEAFEQFFTNMQPDSGMGFVLVQHLAPTHESILADLIKRYTRMPVFQVTDEMNVEQNCVYIIPPNRDMALRNGKLHLMPPGAPRGLRLPIDFFFRSLAQELREKAICIILSGTGSDGTLGMKVIKGEGGMAMVHEPLSAKYNGMPRNAIATGLVDYILPVAEMPSELIRYVKHAIVPNKAITQAILPNGSEFLQKIFVLLRQQTGHDFSLYKPNTIMRRIQRRMIANYIEHLSDYVRYLEQTPSEVETLFREFLIGVTTFFRDTEPFTSLEQNVIPRLFQDRRPEDTIRVWVIGCSTGEEAYSIAILIRERMDMLGQAFKVQVFATDINPYAIERAREGIYPLSVAADVAPKRLRRFFIQEDEDSYRIRQEIRDMMVFAIQSVVKDPPFSKIDLITCRNMLIYLQADLQKKVLALIHYALKPSGFVLLGSSETLGESDYLFTPIDRKWKLYQRLPKKNTLRTMLDFSPPTGIAMQIRRRRTGNTLAVRQLTEKMLLEHYAPPCVIINEQSEVVYISGRTGKYLEPAVGEASLNLLRMARDGLRMLLSSAIRQVIGQKEPVIYERVEIKSYSESLFIRLTVRPIWRPAAMQGLIMVIFEDLPAPKALTISQVSDPNELGSERLKEVEVELKYTKEYLQNTVEQLETANQELKSANEELQSANEELQSTNEELDTSQEELQSVNEELMTVNTELEHKIEQLTQANNDLNNLLASIHVGTIFLDIDLCVQRFNPPVTEIINLINTDIGRPLAHIASNLPREDLVQEADHVLNTLQIQEKEVQTRDGRWFFLQVRPYRTTSNAIDGVVMTFTEIRQLTRAVQQSSSVIMVLDTRGQLEYVNSKFTEITGLGSNEVIGQHARLLKSEEEPPTTYKQLWKTVNQGQEWRGELRYRRKEHGEYWARVSISPVKDATGGISHFSCVAEEITERKQAELVQQKLLAELEKERDKLRTLTENLTNEVWVCDAKGNITLANVAAAQNLGFEHVEQLLQPLPNLLSELQIYRPDGQKRPPEEAPLLRSLKGETLRHVEEIVIHPHNGQKLIRRVSSTPLKNGSDTINGAIAAVHLVSEMTPKEETNGHLT